MDPLVSVVCLCYNHAEFVAQAIRSVLQQTYPNIQLIVVDDCSTDSSVNVIQQLVIENPSIYFIALPKNNGNCRAFNMALERVRGEFIIDLAADDVMLPDRVARQVSYFQSADESVGVVFSNADYIDAYGNILRNHTAHLISKRLIDHVPLGWIFPDVLRRYFICSPTMMIKKKVLDKLKGYDETLAYEDFDFWVRASRHFQFVYQDETLTHVRRNVKSMSSGWYEPGDRQLHSTYLICKKAVSLCRSAEDKQALIHRIRYEYKQSVFSGNRQEARLFAQLEKELTSHQVQFYFYRFLSWLPLPWPWIRKQYYRWRYA
ncbi:MAG: glycosyltransferase [Bacteroidetes bacterium]|nr:glycosyltransferase [Bacteroidota bacterium]MBS1539881.1 glycosyltransferase [Bacteroidota bacterium]